MYLAIHLVDLTILSHRTLTIAMPDRGVERKVLRPNHHTTSNGPGTSTSQKSPQMATSEPPNPLVPG